MGHEMAAPPKIVKDNSDENIGKPPVIETDISFSEYETGVRLPMDSEDADDIYRAELAKIAEERRKANVSPMERNIDATKESFGVNEAIDASRKKLNGALGDIAEATGSSASSIIQGVGGILVESAMGKVDSRISEVLRSAVAKGIPQGESMSQIPHGIDPHNMVFRNVLGRGKGWEVTTGADPGGFFGNGKRGAQAGVMFKMQMP